MRRLIPAILLSFCAASADASSPPPRSVQVFFDDQMQENVLWTDSFVIVHFKILAFDLPGDVAAYRFRFLANAGTAAAGLSFPDGVTNQGAGDNYELVVDGDCLDGAGLVTLADGIVVLGPYEQDVTLCLSPLPGVEPPAAGLAYRACGSTVWQELTLLYEGCAVINPYADYPPPIVDNDANGVAFELASVQGEPTDSVGLTITVNSALLAAKATMPLGRIVLDLAWDPSVATYDHLQAHVPGDWTVAAQPDGGSLHVVLAGATPFAPAFTGTALADVVFDLGENEGVTAVTGTIADLRDATDAPVAFLPPAAAELAVTCVKGDVVANGRISALDALVTLEFAAALRDAGPREFCRADLNGNEMIDAGDAVAILARAVGNDLKSAPERAPWISTTDTAVVLHAGAAAGVDVLMRWDPDLAGLADWSAPAFQSAERRAEGELQLALMRTAGDDATITLELDHAGVEILLEKVRFWDGDGALAADLGGDRVTVGSPVPSGLRLLPPHPNPFNPATSIRFEMAEPGGALIIVHDARGRQVWSTQMPDAVRGANDVLWRGVDDGGRALASGSYFIVLETAAGRATTRVTLLR